MNFTTDWQRLDMTKADVPALEVGASVFGNYRPVRGPMVRLSRNVLFVTMLVIYTGALPFFITFSSDLLYGTYLVIGVCAVGILSFERGANRSLLSVVPYLVWLLVFYCFWGSLVASTDLPEDEVIKMFIKNLVVLGAFALAVIDRRDLARAAKWVQCGALLNLAICFWELWDPKLIWALAAGRDPGTNAFNLLRPAGLWRNPDEAAFAFVFAFLLSHWAGRRLAWIARVGCLAGLYLTASRTGVYIIALCGVVHFGLKLRSRGFFFRSLKAFSLGLAALAAVALVLTGSSTLRTVSVENQWQIRRIIDFAEDRDRDTTELTRLEIAQDALERIFERPWVGSGVFSFDPALGNSGASNGVHNVFLLVWGEAGIPGIVSFLLVLALGVRRIFQRQIAKSEASTMLLMWISYFAIGLTWHNQFTAFSGMFYAALLYHLPSLLRLRDDSTPTVQTRESFAC
jgi:O-antigen ligase